MLVVLQRLVVEAIQIEISEDHDNETAGSNIGDEINEGDVLTQQVT